MDPLTILLLAAITLYSVFITVFFAYLTWLIVVEWFQDYEEVATQSENVAATIKITVESGEAAIVQGVFNRNTGNPVKGRIIKYNDLDSRVSEVHRNNDVVIWQ